jgi:plastocyanin
MIGPSRSIGQMLVLFGGAALAACGGDNSGNGGYGGGGPDPAALSAARSEPSGNAQSGSAGQDLATPMRIVVLRGSTPTAGAVINWSATGAGALMMPSVDTTGPDGISTSVWHLGSAVGAQSSQAAVSGGADGSPVKFSATATSTSDGGGGGGEGPYGIQLLSDGSDHFEPANITVPVGATVTWTWVSGFHSVTPTGAPSFTGNGAPVSAPATFSQTFAAPGTYLYYCLVHGTPSSGMRGTIIVQ